MIDAGLRKSLQPLPEELEEIKQSLSFCFVVMRPEGDEPNILRIYAMKVFKAPVIMGITLYIVENVAISWFWQARKATPGFKLTQLEGRRPRFSSLLQYRLGF